ncbi:HEPN domain-containing protein [Methanococcoides seepicolus]|uniref:RiboL-PSP-HEPN domain-containing protein n=1 Tax=Methanococcoides seepicolus TaxID=2828780 RepID=A0A9E4ZES8_9EURY|nr:HEPN domain-containing protein [Methanococcoides seepicolus]MCM1985609.1 hypothetical protein [Methanococcoides seepicolus]
MNDHTILEEHLELYNDLLTFTQNANDKLVAGDDEFITLNMNFFTKSLMVISCAYLESYLKKASNLMIDTFNLRINNAKVPHNLVDWSLNKKKSKPNDEVRQFSFEITDDDIDSELSGNVYLTLAFFKKLGINLDANPDFFDCKDRVGSLVDKRNNIVHQNDDASDISPLDIMDNITFLMDYIGIIDEEVVNKLALEEN